MALPIPLPRRPGVTRGPPGRCRTSPKSRDVVEEQGETSGLATVVPYHHLGRRPLPEERRPEYLLGSDYLVREAFVFREHSNEREDQGYVAPGGVA